MAKRGRPPHPDVLTPREWEVLDLIRSGLTNDQIADRIGVTIHAARYHVSQILSKLGVATREEAAAWQPSEAGRPRWSRALQFALGLAAAVALVAVAVLAWGVLRGSESDAQTSLDTAQITSNSVRSMQLVNESFGWFLTNEALIAYYQEDEFCARTHSCKGLFVEGHRDITPSGVDPAYITAVHFLDPNVGWLAVDLQVPHELQVAVYRTVDGGLSWTNGEVPARPENLSRFPGANASYFDFVDANTGWLVLKTFTESNDLSGELWHATDGGATWQELSIPLGGPISFIDAQTGWVVQDDPHRFAQIYVTRDGGETWLDALQPNSRGRSIPRGEPSGFTAPIVRESDGSFLMINTGGNGEGGALLKVLVSTDGEDWTVESEFDTGGVGYFDLLPSGGIIGAGYSGGILRRPPNVTEPTTFDANLVGVISDIDFVDMTRGWALAQRTRCIDQTVFEPHGCHYATFIMQTDNGGETWRLITYPDLPSPRPNITPFEMPDVPLPTPSPSP